MKIAGSFLKIADDKEKILKLNEVADQIHFDIMDGKFTENKTIDLDILSNNIKGINKPIDIHLMVIDIKKYVDAVLKFNPEYIIFHIEAAQNTKEIIEYIKSKNVKVGLAINPETDIKDIYDYLKYIDLILIMSVPPGKGGQKFIDISDKINTIYEYRKKNNLSYIIEADGGINDKTINKVNKVDIAVSGSYITDSLDYNEQVKTLKKQINNSGFTLAELLGVIVILSIIGLIAITSIDKNMNESRVQTCKTQEKNIIEAAKTWVIDNRITTSQSVKISVLKNGGYIEDLENPMTEAKYKNNSAVIITTDGKKYSYQMCYKSPDKDCEGNSSTSC